MSLKNDDPGTFKFQWAFIRPDGSLDQGEVVFTDMDQREIVGLIAGVALLAEKEPASVTASAVDDSDYRVRLLS